MNRHDEGITRRRWLKATGALAGVSAIGSLAPAWGQAGGKVVVGTWGGDYSKLLSKNICVFRHKYFLNTNLACSMVGSNLMKKTPLWPVSGQNNIKSSYPHRSLKLA